MNARLLSLLTIASAVSCTSVALTRPPQSALERSVFFREAAADGWHGISNSDPLSSSVTRVITPAGVDAESRIELLPDAARLAEAAEAAGADPVRTRLRLEAWIERPGADPAPLHLPGYDALSELELRASPRVTTLRSRRMLSVTPTSGPS